MYPWVPVDIYRCLSSTGDLFWQVTHRNLSGFGFFKSKYLQVGSGPTCGLTCGVSYCRVGKSQKITNFLLHLWLVVQHIILQLQVVYCLGYRQVLPIIKMKDQGEFMKLEKLSEIKQKLTKEYKWKYLSIYTTQLVQRPFPITRIKVNKSTNL